MFFRARDPAALARWYADHLGIDRRRRPTSSRRGGNSRAPTGLSPFPADSDAFGRPEHAWMLNLRVRDLNAMSTNRRKQQARAQAAKERAARQARRERAAELFAQGRSQA